MKCVALVEWDWSGHHPAFFNYFVLALEELGIEVLAFCPNPDEAEALAASTRPRPDGTPLGRGSTRFFAVSSPEIGLGWLRPRRIVAIYSVIRRFGDLEKQIGSRAKECGLQVGSIIYACIYDRIFEWIRFASPMLRIPWVGLYLQAQSYRMPGVARPGTRVVPRPEKIFSMPSCKGLFVLDEGKVGSVAEHLRKPVFWLPDLADSRLACGSEDVALSGRLKTFAAGRPIVMLVGHLQKSKGLMAFLQAARLADDNRVCFSLVGDVLWPSDEREANDARRAIRECGNLWCHLERIPSEGGFNQLLAVCDVLAAAYVDFPHSSNILAKAAVFEKPVIVSEGYLMAERVRRFRTGEIVDQHDADGLLSAVYRITDDPVGWRRMRSPQWSEYREEHSFDNFRQGIEQLLSPILGNYKESASVLDEAARIPTGPNDLNEVGRVEVRSDDREKVRVS